MRALAAIGLLGFALAGPAAGASGGLVRAVDARLPAVRDADEAQSRYDAGRDLAEAVRGSGRFGPGCRRFASAASALAAAEIEQAEGVDAVSSGRVREGARAAALAWTRIAAARPACLRSDPAPAGLPTVPLVAPQPDAVVPGKLVVSARAPAGAAWATVAVGAGRLDCRRRIGLGPGRKVTRTLRVGTGPRDVRVGFCSARGLVATGESSRVWVLPATAARRLRRARTDAQAAARLAAAGRTFSGYTGVWSRDLATGRTAGANDGARFPAASTVKLGVLVAALRRFGPRAEHSPVAYDLEALAERSSNLATNRLLVKIGGSPAAGAAAADRVLKELGATSSTFTGPYRIGTSRSAEPPRVSGRVTTARDLGRVLAVIHAGAIRGDPVALRRLGLSWHEAQVALNLLLSSDRSFADNSGLFSPFLGSRTPIAQKNGWLRDARHTAAIVYAPGGPRIVVLLTYRPQLRLADAQALGRRVLRALRF